MREYLIHNKWLGENEPSIQVTEMLLNTQSMVGASGQTDVYQSVAMKWYEFYGPSSFLSGAIGLMLDYEKFFKSVSDHFPVF